MSPKTHGADDDVDDRLDYEKRKRSLFLTQLMMTLNFRLKFKLELLPYKLVCLHVQAWREYGLKMVQRGANRAEIKQFHHV